jgi:2-polyprenyl-3-methyl-5-hydroxy-6-metoxy-1,4-benzoquinol methylase
MNWRWKIAQAAEWRWWGSYLRDKPIEAYLTQKRAYWLSIVQKAGIELTEGEKVLDAGCGPAGIFIILDDQEVDAIDPLLKKYEQTLRHFQPANYANVAFSNQTLEELSSEEQYDWVFCMNVINHVAELEWSLKRMARSLKKDKKLVLSVDVHKYRWLKTVFQILPGDVLHPHQYDLAGYIKKIETAGVQVEETICLKTGNIFDYYLILGKKV